MVRREYSGELYREAPRMVVAQRCTPATAVGLTPVGPAAQPQLTSHSTSIHCTSTNTTTMIATENESTNMGRGAYDTTGTPKPPSPPPK
ncbi:hypothetical protein B5807_03498 [Epicoccum nigrum]|uniref:Uncharacterized protein n=1 Tax=Epicoccum nigrum TaxID=105696 RepID=A0A1Y2M582_EPING|nr:hypothetical protein B5807_03498 [Epicoccum nigrum]